MENIRLFPKLLLIVLAITLCALYSSIVVSDDYLVIQLKGNALAQELPSAILLKFEPFEVGDGLILGDLVVVKNEFGFVKKLISNHLSNISVLAA
jgi:hypothetical protein